MKIPRPGIVVIATIVLSVNAVYFWYVRRNIDLHKEHLAYGAVLPLVSLNSLQGKPLDWHGKYLLLIFFEATSEEGLRRANFANSLYRQYHARGLEIVAVINGSSSEVEKRVRDSEINYPVVADNHKLDTALVFGDHEYEVLFVNPEQHVLFSSAVFMPDDLRQLVERYLVGHVSYFPSLAQSRLQVGDKFPLFTVQDLKTNRSGIIDLSGRETLVIISASCSACSLAPGTTIISQWLKNQPTTTANQPLVIFSSKFTRTEVQKVTAELHADVVRAQESLPLIENKDSLNGLFENYILVINLREGSVSKLTSIM